MSELPPRPGHSGRHSGRRPSFHAARHIPRLPTRASQPRRQSERFQSLPTIRNHLMQWPNIPTTPAMPFRHDEQFLRRYKLATYMAVFAVASASILFIFMIAVTFYIMAKLRRTSHTEGRKRDTKIWAKFRPCPSMSYECYTHRVYMLTVADDTSRPLQLSTSPPFVAATELLRISIFRTWLRYVR